MNFKKWLIKEDPEVPVLKTVGKQYYAGDKEINFPVNWRSHDALSFGILKNFYMYADSSMGLYHKDILDELWKMIKYPGKKIYTMDDNIAGDIKVHGELNSEALKQINNWIKAVEKDFFKKDREASLFYAPNFVLGRIWTEEKIISFWNKEWVVFNNSDDIINFIKLFGDPHDYMFEVENEWKDYGDFVRKKQGKLGSNFDPAKLHVMDPSIKGQVMKASGVTPYKIGPGIKTLQKVYTSETTLYHGTRAQFDDLKPNRARFGSGVSFTTNPDIAFNYALGRYKGGKQTGEPIVKKIEYSGNSFNFFEKVPVEVAEKVLDQIIPYLEEFTPDKKRLFLKNIYGVWTISGEKFYKELQRAFAKKGTDEECRLAKSRNTNLDICSSCSVFQEMPDLLNSILKNIGFDSLCYDDNNDGISHRCYFLIK